MGLNLLSESLSGILRQMASLFLRAGIGSFKGADGTGGSGLLGLFEMVQPFKMVA